MLGWGVGVFRQKDGGGSPATCDNTISYYEDAVMPAIAGWDALIDGLHWIDELVKDEKAFQLEKGWTSSIYTVQAKDLMFLLKSPPPSVFTYGSRPEYQVNKDELRSCPPEEWLIVMVCDLG